MITKATLLNKREVSIVRGSFPEFTVNILTKNGNKVSITGHCTMEIKPGYVVDLYVHRKTTPATRMLKLESVEILAPDTYGATGEYMESFEFNWDTLNTTR